MKNSIAVFFSAVILLTSVVSHATQQEQPILIIGASFANGATPIDDNLNAPLGGIAVGLGDYLSLGDALIREPRLSGHVINEAQAGATSFTRYSCNPVCDHQGTWQSYDVQLSKALKRVTIPQTNISLAKFVVVSLANDCMHSDAFGLPMDQTAPCTMNQMQEVADRMVLLGQRITSLGMVPVFLRGPEYQYFDMDTFAQVAGLSWVINQADYQQLQQIIHTTLTNEVPTAVSLEVWQNYEPLADGLHPSRKSTIRAAKRIAKFVKRNQ